MVESGFWCYGGSIIEINEDGTFLCTSNYIGEGKYTLNGDRITLRSITTGKTYSATLKLSGDVMRWCDGRYDYGKFDYTWARYKK